MESYPLLTHMYIQKQKHMHQPTWFILPAFVVHKNKKESKKLLNVLSKTEGIEQQDDIRGTDTFQCHDKTQSLEDPWEKTKQNDSSRDGIYPKFAI